MHWRFEKVTAQERQIEVLYALLQKRVHIISHARLPDYEDHRQFVCAHPYRAWYLVYCDDEVVGSFYVTNMNEIGIDAAAASDDTVINSILDFVLETHEPLPPIRSVRGRGFFVNVPESNQNLQSTLARLGHTCIQRTFRLND